ncbi:MAG: 50S ribosomal protein L25/general stress protein Ctc [Bacteroidales bacterium OttesenSCG-928-I14]|jgi:large subunit ribosomal protein L25|nr:50S ribosomal protein L25/general stress protein Ctc [Bacteroidales bacterium OttesenSCG-928-I14]
MKIFQLKGSKRNIFGKKAAKMHRKELLIPCILYGGSENTIHFNVSKDNVRKLIYTPIVYLVSLSIEEQSYLSILKEIQFHPVSDEILHIDFLQIFENKPTIINIPIALEGTAKGIKEGGKLSLKTKTLKIKGIYKNFPEKIIINVENLELNKTIKVGDLFFENLELLNAKDTIVVSIKLTRATVNPVNV